MSSLPSGNSHDNNEDELLVTLLSCGDRDAFERIYRKYSGELYTYARRNISLKEDCEEIIQDVFEALWSRRGHHNITVLQFYLLRMVRNKVIRYFQHSAVKRKYAEHYLLFEAVFDQTNEEKERFDDAALKNLIDKSLVKLPERCQTAFKLRLTENLSNTEIAHRMNISNKTVENYLVIVLRHLRDSYQNLYRAG